MKTLQRKQGVQVNLLEGNIFLSMVQFAIPILFSNLFQQLYNTMDTIIVGHTLGETALAAIGAASPVYDLLVGFALGIGSGLSIVTGRSYGAKDENLLKKSVASSMVIGVVLTTVLTVIGQLFMKTFLRLLNTPEEIMAEAYSYISVIILFMGVMFAYNLFAGILRAIGNSVMPLVFLIISSVLNVFLDFLFIVGFKMGIRGAAVATVLSQGISVVLCIIYILKCVKIVIPAKEHFRFERKLYSEMLAQGFSMGVMHCLVSAGTAILQAGINNLGYLVIAGHTAARKLFSFSLMPFSCMIMAVNSFLSQNFGAGRVDRIRKAMKYAYIYDLIVTIIITIIFTLFASDLVYLVSGSEEAVILENGTNYLRVLGPALVVVAVVNETRTALQAIGSKVLPLCSSLIELVGKIIFVTVLVPKFQYNAVVFCEPVIWCFMAAFLLMAFWRNPHIKEGKKVGQ